MRRGSRELAGHFTPTQFGKPNWVNIKKLERTANLFEVDVNLERCYIVNDVRVQFFDPHDWELAGLGS